jgi:CRISPR-associated protein Csd1
MQRFAERPYSTWRTIELGLRPYIARLGGRRAHLYERQLDDVLSSFDPDDFKRDTPLGGEFLLGFHSQREALTARFKQAQDGETDSDEATDVNELQS